MIGKIATFFKTIMDYSNSDYCLFKYFKEAFRIVNKNIVLTTPLLFFSVFTTLYMYFIQYQLLKSPQIVIVMLFIAILLSAVFVSGWYHTIKLSIEDFNNDSDEKNEQEEKDALKILKQFPAGVGEHFLQILLMLLIFTVLLSLIIGLAILGITHNSGAYNPKSSIYTFYGITFIGMFATTFWIPEIIYNKTNALKALWIGFKKLFKKFFKVLTIFCSLLLTYLIIYYFVIRNNNDILGFLLLIVCYYFQYYAPTLIMLFYKREIADNEQ